MKHNTKLAVFFILSVVVALMSYFYQASSLNLQVLFNTQQPDFLFDSDYFYSFFTMHGGLSEYVSKYLLQFFEFQMGGAIVVAVLSVLFFAVVYLLFKDILRGVVVYFASFLPVIVFNFLFSNPYFPLSSAISVLLAFSAVLLIKFVANNRKLLLVSSIILPWVVYSFVSSGAFMLFAASSILVILQSSGIKQKWVSGIILLVYAFVIPYLSFHYIWNSSISKAYYSFLPDVSIHLRYISNSVFQFFKYFIPAILIVALVFNLFVEKIPQIGFLKRIYIPIALFSILLIGFVFFVSINSEPTIKNEHALIDYYGYKGDWPKVEELILNSPYDVINNFYYIRAIDNQGVFLKRFFNYPQYAGADILFPDKFRTGELSLFSCDYYYELGYYEEALHWAYETYTRNLYDKRVLKRLVELNFILHNYDEANFYLATLNKCMYTEDFVNKYTQLIKQGKTKSISVNVVLKELKDSIEISGEFKVKCKNLLLMDTTNRRAYEHLQMHYLLNHQIGDFVNTYHKYSWLNAKVLPEVFADGIILYLLRTNSNNFGKYPISKASYKKFNDFSKTLKERKDNKEWAQAELKPYYSNTYMYYLYFDSPKVTNRSLGKNPNPEYQN